MLKVTGVLFFLAVCVIARIDASFYDIHSKDCLFGEIYKDGEDFDVIEMCLKCKCKERGVSCQGYGNYINEDDLPKECKIIEPRECYEEAVLKKDESQPCPVQPAGV